MRRKQYVRQRDEIGADQSNPEGEFPVVIEADPDDVDAAGGLEADIAHSREVVLDDDLQRTEPRNADEPPVLDRDIVRTTVQATPAKIATVAPQMKAAGHIRRLGISSGVAPVASSHNRTRNRWELALFQGSSPTAAGPDPDE